MRKTILSALFVMASTFLFAQNLKEIQGDVEKGKFEEARAKVDKALADPKNQNTANFYYYKGVVYTEIAKDTTKNDLNYWNESFNAFKRYQELDSKNILMTLNQNAHLFSIYENYYNLGIKDFNDKNYKRAFDRFSNALAVKDYVYTRQFSINDFSFPAMDTQLLNLAGAAAILSENHDAAIPYYTALANAKLKGDDYKDIYPILVDYYAKKGDDVNKKKYLAIGQELYPENTYWVQSQIAEAGDDKAKLFAKYQELIKENPQSYELAVDYGVELFNYVYNQNKPADYEVKLTELGNALKNAIAIDANQAYPNFIMSQHISNQIYDMQQVYNGLKGTKPEDVKKKQDLNKQIEARFEELYLYSNNAHQIYAKNAELKPGEKANFRIVTNNMIDYYKMKKNTEKIKELESKLTAMK